MHTLAAAEEESDEGEEGEEGEEDDEDDEDGEGGQTDEGEGYATDEGEPQPFILSFFLLSSAQPAGRSGRPQPAAPGQARCLTAPSRSGRMCLAAVLSCPHFRPAFVLSVPLQAAPESHAAPLIGYSACAAGYQTEEGGAAGSEQDEGK